MKLKPFLRLDPVWKRIAAMDSTNGRTEDRRPGPVAGGGFRPPGLRVEGAVPEGASDRARASGATPYPRMVKYYELPNGLTGTI